MDDYLEQLQSSQDSISLSELDAAYPVRDVNLVSPREKRLQDEFDMLKVWVGGNANLKIMEGTGSSYFHAQGRVAINLDKNDNYGVGLSKTQIETIDLYVLAHECGHLGQWTLAGNRYLSASKRSKEGCADYVAGGWLGIRLGQNLPMDSEALAKIAFQLKGGGDGPTKYPYQEQRHLLVSWGKSNLATQQFVSGTSPDSLKQSLESDHFQQLWDASEKHI